MIEATNLSKAYGAIQALNGVSCQVAEGEIVGLLGPNGAGKTTLIKILTGYLQPDAGTVRINQLDVLEDTRAVQAQIGYLPETAPLYPELSTQEYLQMMAALRQIPESEQRARLSEAIYATGLEKQLPRPIGQLSKGFRQRVGLAQAILHQPRILILDEPTVGLDPTQILEVRGLIRRLAKNSTILYSTHILSEVESLCDRVVILMNGVVKADARLSELAATSDAVLILGEKLAGVAATLRQLPGVRGVETLPDSEGRAVYHVLGDSTTDLCPALYDLSRGRDWPLAELRRDVRTLETVFNNLATTGEVRA